MEKVSYNSSNFPARKFCPQKKTKPIWVESPCTLAFGRSLSSFEKAPRFTHNSIYSKHEKQNYVQIDSIQKPHAILMQFRKNIKEVDNVKKNQKDFLAYDTKIIGQQKSRLSKKRKNKQISNMGRLCPKNQKKIQLEFDRNGMRSTFYESQNSTSKKLRKHQKKLSHAKSLGKTEIFFTECERSDFAKPDNFHPGPGTYFSEFAYCLHRKRKSQNDLKIERLLRKKRHPTMEIKFFSLLQNLQTSQQNNRKVSTMANNSVKQICEKL